MPTSALRDLSSGEFVEGLAKALPEYLLRQRWFGGKARPIESARVLDTISVHLGSRSAIIVFVRISYSGGAPELYAIPLIKVDGEPPQLEQSSLLLVPESPNYARAAFSDALRDEAFLELLLHAIQSGGAIVGERSQIASSQTSALQSLGAGLLQRAKPKPIRAEQSNTSIKYGDVAILKFFRRLEEGINGDLEVGQFLTETAGYGNTPKLLGSLEYHNPSLQTMTQAVLQAFVPNQGDAWSYTLESVSSFYREARDWEFTPSELAGQNPAFAESTVNPYLEMVALLARRTAELHLALARDPHNPAFAPEPFDTAFQTSLRASLEQLTIGVFGLLRQRVGQLPAQVQSQATAVVASEPEILQRFSQILQRPFSGSRTRIHGDYHLGQILFTGSDFYIIDFEGEPARPLAERKTKRSPLQDVAGMLRSFHYAAYAPLLTSQELGPVTKDQYERLAPWAEAWNQWVTTRFLEEYFRTARQGKILPDTSEEISQLLNIHLLEKAVYELGYELNNRPDWVAIPLEGISKVLKNHR